MSTPTYKSVPHNDAFATLRNSHGVILNELEVSRLSAAIQGIHAITATLQQREFDAEVEYSEGLTFGPGVALGLLAALATCTELVSGALEGVALAVPRANCDTPAYEHLMEARHRVREANCGEA